MMRLIFAICFLLTLSVSAAEKFTASELDTLVSTIALYPDPLLVHVLTASTYGDQIANANTWAQAHRDLQGQTLAEQMEKADLPYDPSVQALIPFPTILATMAKYPAWTDQLGDAVAAQKDQVMDAIQRLRSAAYEHGQLKTDEQNRVEKENTIIIEPVRAEYVYVPVYNPSVVYYVYANDYPSIRYLHHVWLGSWYGEWGWGSCWFEWDSHYIYVRDYRWYHHRDIPRHPHRYRPPNRTRKLEPVHPSHRPADTYRTSTRPSNNFQKETVRPSQQQQDSYRWSTRTVSPSGGVWNASKRAENNSQTRSQRVDTPAPSKQPINASSSGNAIKKKAESTSDYREEDKSSSYEHFDSRRSAPSTPSGTPSGGVRKSKRR